MGRLMIKTSKGIVELLGDQLASLNVVVHCVEEAVEALELSFKTDKHQQA